MSLVMVGFRGDGDGTEELTWSQMSLWEGMTMDGPPVTVGGVVEPPQPTTVAELAGMLAFAVGRHQALRTRLKLRGDQLPQQVCVSSGEVPLELVDAGDGDPEQFALAVEKRYQTTPFDYENEFPVRMAAIHRDSRVVRIVAVYLHLAMDFGSVTALMNDIAARDPRTGDAIGRVTSIQPMELAARQRKTRDRRASATASAYLAQVLRLMPVRQFGERRYGESGTRIVRLRSRATALAMRRIAARESISTSSAVLAAFAVGVTGHTGHRNVMAMLLVSNRFRPGLADAVCPVTQMSPCLIDVSGATLHEVVVRTGASVLAAYKHAYYDPREQAVVFDEIEAERGELDCWLYNDRRDLDRSAAAGPPPTEDEVRAALGASEHSWIPAKKNTAGLYLSIVDGPDGAVDLELMAGSRLFSESDMIALTSRIETAAVRIALEPDSPCQNEAWHSAATGGEEHAHSAG